MVPNQNGASKACYIVKIHHSGQEPSICNLELEAAHIMRASRDLTVPFCSDVVLMGLPSRGQGVSQLSLPIPFSPSWSVLLSTWNLLAFLLFSHQILPTHLQFSFSDCPFCLHQPFTYISLVYKAPLAPFPFLCGLLHTWHTPAVGQSVKIVPKVDQVDKEPVPNGCEGGRRHFKGRWCSPVSVDKPCRRRKTDRKPMN